MLNPSTVNIHYLAHSMEVLKCLKFLPLNLVPWACADEFLATVTVVHVVYKVVTWSSLDVTQ